MTEIGTTDVGEIIKADVDQPFWDACALGEFLVHRCGICGRSYWPASCCIHHGARAMRWCPASGKGEVHTYTIFHHAYRPSWKDRVPYVVAVVKLQEGPFYLSRIVQCPVDQVKSGMAVELAFETEDDGGILPVFKPAF
jgi:uncharacterized OB-fold protein